MKEIITSANNPSVKQLRKQLSSSKERRETNTYVAEGIHLVKSYANATTGRMPLEIFTSVSAHKNTEIIEIVEQLPESIQNIILADSLFESLTSIHASVGIVITFSPEKPHQEEVAPLHTNAILLENIQDPGNIGTILRTAAATGVKYVLLSASCASAWSPKALRAGMGAQFDMAIYDDVELVKAAKAAKIPVYATTLAQDSASLFDLDLRSPVAWIFGNEGKGISGELTRAATSSVLIPQAVSSIESLNVASAAAVCLYEQYRQMLSL